MSTVNTVLGPVETSELGFTLSHEHLATNAAGILKTFPELVDRSGIIEQANATQYGLSASVWTRDLDRAHHVAEQLHVGTVWVNCWLLRDLRVPFGGMKSSGLGREGGDEALRFFTEPKNVCIRIGPR